MAAVSNGETLMLLKATAIHSWHLYLSPDYADFGRKRFLTCSVEKLFDK